LGPGAPVAASTRKIRGTPVIVAGSIRFSAIAVSAGPNQPTPKVCTAEMSRAVSAEVRVLQITADAELERATRPWVTSTQSKQACVGSASTWVTENSSVGASQAAGMGAGGGVRPVQPLMANSAMVATTRWGTIIGRRGLMIRKASPLQRLRYPVGVGTW
jgi:hypothetical protein